MRVVIINCANLAEVSRLLFEIDQRSRPVAAAEFSLPPAAAIAAAAAPELPAGDPDPGPEPEATSRRRRRTPELQQLEREARDASHQAAVEKGLYEPQPGSLGAIILEILRMGAKDRHHLAREVMKRKVTTEATVHATCSTLERKRRIHRNEDTWVITE